MPGEEVVPLFANSMGVRNFGSTSNMVNFRKSVMSYINEKDKPVYFSPEEKITNGKALLKFKSYPFSFSEVIQPIIIQIKRPFLDISITTLGASYWTDVFFYMLSPVTIYNLKFLPVHEKGQSSEEEFAEKVRHILAQKLGVPITNFTAAEVIEWEKRKIVEQQRTRIILEPNRTLKMQALQVKEVLPHVPMNVIYEDLSRTRNVDTTISNILEGHVSFVPEPVRQPSQFKNSSPSTSSAQGSSSASASTSGSLKTFAKNAQDRSKSFQARKEEMIAEARRRYIEKHNLDIPL